MPIKRRHRGRGDCGELSHVANAAEYQVEGRRHEASRTDRVAEPSEPTTQRDGRQMKTSPRNDMNVATITHTIMDPGKGSDDMSPGKGLDAMYV